MIPELEYAAPAGVGILWSMGILLIRSARVSKRQLFAQRVRAGRPAVAQGALSFTQSSFVTSLLEAIGSTSTSVRRRLILLGKEADVPAFRLHQVIAAITGMILCLAIGTPLAMSKGNGGLVLVLILIAVGALIGAAAWDQRLGVKARARQRRIDAQVPDASELLALAVGAGESIPAALERIARISRSDLSEEIERTTSQIRLGTPSSRALLELAERNDSAPLDRLCHTLVTAIERGSPLARVLHDQAKDIREAARQSLMEEGGKREIAMLVPVVFLILPVTIVFALYPGLMALSLTP